MELTMSIEINLENIIKVLGQPLKQQGSEYIWQCPICAQSGGDSKKDNLKFNESKSVLKRFADDNHSKMIISDMNKQLSEPRKVSDADRLRYRINKCNEFLLNQPKHLEYILNKRGITEDTIRDFKIGYCDQSKRWLLPAFDLNGKPFGAEERIFERKQITKMKGTVSDLCLINDAMTNVFILVEGFIDGYILYQYLKAKGQDMNYNIITPSNGVNTIPTLIKKFDYKDKELIVFLDNDDAGKKVSKMLENIIEKPYSEIVLPCTCCKDMNDYYLKHSDFDILSYQQPRNKDKKRAYSIGECIESYINDIKNNVYEGVSTGYKDLDKMTNGLRKSGVYVLAARPSMGKTSVALNVALNVAKKDYCVFMFSLETSKQLISKRLLTIETEFNTPDNIKGGKKELTTFINTVKDSINKLPINICDQAGLSLAEMENIILTECETPRLVIIDHLALMKAPNGVYRSEHEKVTAICKDLKTFLQNIGNPTLILLHQLNRSVEQRTNKKPVLSDLRESGSIEEIADIVMMLYRDEYYNLDTEFKNLLEVGIMKNRDGKTGPIKLHWEGELYKVSDYDHFTADIERRYGNKA